MRKILDDLIMRYPVLADERDAIWQAYEIMEECYLHKGKLLIAGNGGSASDSEHICGELMKSFLLKRRLPQELREKLVEIDRDAGEELAENLACALPAIPLVSQAALNTAYINDVGSNGIFAQQVFGLGCDGDVFIGISTSSNSKNIVQASVIAKAVGIKVIVLTGQSGGKLQNYSDVCVKAPETETFKIQELHLPIYHCWCMMLEERFFGNG